MIAAPMIPGAVLERGLIANGVAMSLGSPLQQEMVAVTSEWAVGALDRIVVGAPAKRARWPVFRAEPHSIFAKGE